jgi:hypothetical protein
VPPTRPIIEDPPVAQSTKSFQETIRELWELLTGYARQETVEPLRNLGRRIGLGIAGSFLFSLGWFLITLGTMRLLQTHSLPVIQDWFIVHNWATYGIGLLVLGLGIFGVVRKIRHPDPELALPARAAG